MANTADIRVLLIDSQRLFLTGLSALMASEPGLVVIGQANNRIDHVIQGHSQSAFRRGMASPVDYGGRDIRPLS